MSNILWLNIEFLQIFTVNLCGENVKHFWQNNPLMLRKYYVMLSQLLSGINKTMYHKVLECPIVKDCYGNGLMHKT